MFEHELKKIFLGLVPLFALLTVSAHIIKVRGQTSYLRSGLTNSNVTAFAYDPEGYIWMGTSQGLNRYNGSFFWTFLRDDSLSLINDNIHALLMDEEEERLWIGTDGGLDCYDLASDRFIHPSDGHFDPVYALREWRDSLLIYSDLEGFSVFNKRSFRDVAEIKDPDLGRSRALVATRADEIWIVAASTRSVWRFDAKLGLNARYPIAALGEPIDLLEANDGTLWLATDRSVLKFDQRRRRFVEASAEISKLVDDRTILFLRYVKKDNYFLLGIQGKGLYVYHPAEDKINRIVHQKRFSGVDRCFCYVDPNQTIWLAPAHKGFRVFPVENAFGNHYVHEALESETIQAMGLFDSTRIWLNTERSVALFDPRTKVARMITPAAWNRQLVIRQAFVDSDRRFWIWTNDNVLQAYGLESNGLSRLSNRFAPKGKIQFIFEDPQERVVWVALESQWAKIEMDSGKIIYHKDRPSAHFGKAFYSERVRKNYLLSYDQGLFEIDQMGRTTPVFRSIKNPSCLFVDRDGNTWVGSFNSGLACFSSDGRLARRFDTSDGLPDNSVMSVLEDSAGSIWVCLKNGIVCYSKKSNSWISFAYENFIRDAQFELDCAVHLPGNILCFGNNNGISIIQPNLDDLSTRSIPLGIDAVLVNRKPVSYGKEGIELSHDENFLSVYYSGRDLVNGFLLRYAYQLDGYDKDWIEAGQNSIVYYTNLPPGDYVFRARVQNVDGQWQEEELAFPIRIRPAWWCAPLAIAFYVIFSILLISMAISLHIRWKVNREKLALMEREMRLNRQVRHSENKEPEALPIAAEPLLAPKEQAFMERLYQLLDSHLSDETYNVLSLAQELGISRSGLYSKIKLLTGNSPQAFFIDYRLNRALDYLKSGEFTVSEVSYKVGFSSLAGFSRSFKKRFGYSPSKVKENSR